MTEPMDPYVPAVELATAIRCREVSPVEVAEAYLERIDRLDPQLNAFCHRADDDVRKAASATADAVATRAQAQSDDLPPFLGVPMPIKDLYDVAGWPTTYGSAASGRAPAGTTSPVVQRFVDAGFVPLGKTTASEFGAVPFTESEALGTSRNPWDPDRTPGGSSSGAGVAVAAGLAPIANAGDGGGSIRIPASCTGLVGLKPTRGLVSDETVEVEGFGTSGVVTRTVADAAAALDVLARHDPAAWWSPPHPGDGLHRGAGGRRAGRSTGRRAHRRPDSRGCPWTPPAGPRSTPPCGRSRPPATWSTRRCRCPRPTS
jgi:amidase